MSVFIPRGPKSRGIETFLKADVYNVLKPQLGGSINNQSWRGAVEHGYKHTNANRQIANKQSDSQQSRDTLSSHSWPVAGINTIQLYTPA